VASAMLVGVVVAFGTGNLYVMVLATRRVGQALTLSDLRGGLLGSLGLSLLEVGGLSALRSWLVAAFGFTWGV
jgi:hypothetical protein